MKKGTNHMKLGNQIQNLFKLVAVRATNYPDYSANHRSVMKYLLMLKLDLPKMDQVNGETLPPGDGSHLHNLVSFISNKIIDGVSEFSLSSSSSRISSVLFFIPPKTVAQVDISKIESKCVKGSTTIVGHTFEKVPALGKDASAKEYMICREAASESPFLKGDVLEVKEYIKLESGGDETVTVRRDRSVIVSMPLSPPKALASNLSEITPLPVLTDEDFTSVLEVLKQAPSEESFKANSSQIILTGSARDESILSYAHQGMRVEGVDFKASGKPYCMAQSDVEAIDFSRESNTQIVFSSGKAWAKTMPAAKEAFEKISTISAVGMPTEGVDVKFPNYMNFQKSRTGEITYSLAEPDTPERKIQDELGITGVELKSKGDVLAHVELTLTGDKKIQLYHFFGWPDKEAFPVEKLTDKDNALLAQRYSAYETAHAKTSEALDGAYLTHCSAGIGRTGADAVMNDLLRQMKKKKTNADVLAVLSPDNVLKTRKALSEGSGRFLVQTDAQLRSSAELAAKLYLYRHRSEQLSSVAAGVDVDVLHAVPAEVTELPAKGVTFARTVTSVGTDDDQVAVGMLKKKGLPVHVDPLELDDLSPKWNLTEAGMLNLRAMCEDGASEDVALRTLDKLVNDFVGGEIVNLNGSLNLLVFVDGLKAGFGVDSETSFVDCVREQLNNFEIPEHESQGFESFDGQTFNARRATIKEKSPRRESESSAEDGPPPSQPFVSGDHQAPPTPPPVLVSQQTLPPPPPPMLVLGGSAPVIKVRTLKKGSELVHSGEESQLPKPVRDLKYTEGRAFFQEKKLDAAKFTSFGQQVKELSLYFTAGGINSPEFPDHLCPQSDFLQVLKELVAEYRDVNGDRPDFLSYVREKMKPVEPSPKSPLKAPPPAPVNVPQMLSMAQGPRAKLVSFSTWYTVLDKGVTQELVSVISSALFDNCSPGTRGKLRNTGDVIRNSDAMIEYIKEQNPGSIRTALEGGFLRGRVNAAINAYWQNNPTALTILD